MRLRIKILFAILVVSIPFCASAQQVRLQPVKSVPAPVDESLFSTIGLSSNSAFLLTDLHAGTALEKLAEQYPISIVDGRGYVAAFLDMGSSPRLSQLKQYGIEINSLVGNFATVQIPLERYEEFIFSGICAQVQVGSKVDFHNEEATRVLRSTEANAGHFLPERYDGTGVVVGIIDIGFEYGHPSFYDTTGNNFRVKCVWDQNFDCNTHPAGFSYGKEYLSQSSILNALCSHRDQSHGSHVAGIAAGSGGSSEALRKYRGVAPNADLVLVATNMYTTGIFDGITYIRNYATSVGKPCVINMSLGSNFGPHDGTDLFDQMADTYLGSTPGFLAVASAGNSGGSTLHLGKEFTSQDTSVTTLVSFGGEPSGNSPIDCWGMPGDTFAVQLGILNIYTGVYEDATYLYSSAYSTNYSTTLTDSDGETISLDVFCTSANASNGRPNISVRIYADNQTSSYQYVALRVVARNTTVHCWANDANFVSEGVAQVVSGDNAYTTSANIGSAASIITVGSYISRDWWQSINGQGYSYGGTVGALSGFSSHGPTLDGRTKPDIVGPGQVLLSSVNRFDQRYANHSSAFVVEEAIVNGQHEYYGAMQGTSMSSPAVTGVMALWLQANPNLTQGQAHQMLHSTAFQDNFTGAIAPTGSNEWGWGKVNLYAGLPVTDDTIVASQCHITTFPYVENCEAVSECWTAIDDEAETSSWHYNSNWSNQAGIVNHRGNAALVSLPTQGGVDHVLLSPLVSVPSNGSGWTFSWEVGSYNNQGNTSDIYWVYVVYDGNDYLLYQGSLYNQHTLVRQGICLDGFRGHDVRLKIVHFGFPENYGITLDNLTISQDPVVPQVRIQYAGTLEGPIRIGVGDTLEVEALVLNEVDVNSYVWTEQMGDHFVGSCNERIAKFVWDFDVATWINVTVNGPSGTDSYLREVIVGNVAINQVESAHVELYPNPTTGVLHIATGAEVLSVVITDAVGRAVKLFSGTTVNISDLSNGIYFVRVNTPAGYVIRKVVKR